MKTDVSELRVEYRLLQRQLARTGWISHGYVQDRGPGAGGPCYQWSRKERKKTVSVALSQEQYLWMKEAIANWRHVQDTLKRMEQISRLILFRTISEPPRRKLLSKKVLGLN
jgi:hypothetical protein